MTNNGWDEANNPPPAVKPKPNRMFLLILLPVVLFLFCIVCVGCAGFFWLSNDVSAPLPPQSAPPTIKPDPVTAPVPALPMEEPPAGTALPDPDVDNPE